MSTSVVFLMFHELEITSRELCQREPGYVRYVLPLETFRRLMMWLKDQGWGGASVGEWLSEPKQKSVCITFDDGCETDLIAAAPALCEFHFRATFYITTGFMGRAGYLSRDQVKELSSLGFELGCHSASHPYLTELDEAGLRREITQPKRELEDLLGRRVEHFSCPGGRFNHRVADFVRSAGYKTMATSVMRANPAHGDQFALGRVAVLRHTNVAEFAAICRGQGLWRLNLGNQFRSLSRNVLGNTWYDRVRAFVLDRN